MSTIALVTPEEYLATSYRPDCDLVDGVLLERNVGNNDHSSLQAEVLAWFRERRGQLHLRAFPEQRIRVAPGRYRVPDVCIVPWPKPTEQVFTTPPCVCIEILSPDDTFPELQQRLDDCLAMGVPNIWVIDADSRRGWVVTRQGHFEALGGVLRSTDGTVAMPVSDLFSAE